MLIGTETKRSTPVIAVLLALALVLVPCGSAFAADESAILGHVYGPDGVTPVEGIRVFLVETNSGEFTETYTDSTGAYSFTGLRDWVFYIDFDPTQYNTTHDPDLAPPPDKALVRSGIPGTAHDVVLNHFGAISGHVLALNGEPLQGIKVSVFSARVSKYVYSDASGGFAFDRLPPDEFNVWFQTYEYNETHAVKFEQARLTWKDVPPGETTIEQALFSWCPIAGRVTGPSGEALTSVRMYTSKPPYTSWDNAGSVDGNGNFDFTRFDGSYKVKAVPAGGVLLPAVSDVVTVSMGSRASVDLSSRLGGRVKGHVLGPDGETVPDVWVRVQSGMLWAEAPTDANGAYDLGPFFSGSYTVTFEPSGHNANNPSDDPDLLPATYPGLVSVTEGAETSGIDMTLSTYCITGRILGPDGLPVEGVLVSAEGNVFSEAETDANGDFAIRDLAYGYYTISVDPSDYNAANHADLAAFTYYTEVYVSASSQPRLYFTMRRAGTISGHVWDANGAPLEGVLVWADGPSYGDTYTVADGSYSIDGLYPGWYDVGFDPFERNQSHDPDYPEVMLASMAYAPEGSVLSGVDAHLEAIVPPPPPPPPVPKVSIHRFYNVKNGSHFYTPSEAERDMVISRFSTVYQYEGVAYTINPVTNQQPLYRFYNRNNGSHFYTASAAEADAVMAKWSNIFTYDGPTYGVTSTNVPGATPVHRFYNKNNGSHFYTASDVEAARVKKLYWRVFTYEGAAFWLSP